MKVTNPTAPQVAPPTEEDKLRQVSRQYEAMFVNQLVTAMRKTITRGGLIPESQGEKVYQSMLDNEYSQKIADSDQLGLSKLIYNQLLQTARGGK
jgi:flagellar protein FlgJ